jgi:hypothetical protein
MLWTSRCDSRQSEHACDVDSGHGVLQSGEVALKILAPILGAVRKKHRIAFALNLCA